MNPDIPLDEARHTPQADGRWLLGYILRHGGAAFGAIAAGMIGGVTNALEPYLIGVIVDHVSKGLAFDTMSADIALMLALAVVTVGAFFAQRYYSGVIAYNVNFDIRRDLFDNLLTLEQAFYQRYPSGDLISRMNSDLEVIWRLLVMFFTRIGSAALMLVMMFLLLGTVNLTLTLVTFAVLAISTGFQMRAGTVLMPVFERVQDQAGVLAALVQDTFSGIQTVKTFGRETGAARKFYEENDEYRQRWLRFRRRNEPVGMLPNMISQATTGVVVLFGGIMTLQGALTLGNFTQFLIYLGMISNVLLQLGTIYQRFQQARGALARLTPLLSVAQITSDGAALPLPAPRGDVTLEGVGVDLEGKTLLDDVTLHVPAGTVVGLVGATGSSKTLLVSLLARVLDPTRGTVRVDGADVRGYRLDALRRAIAYVPQSTFLFSQTLEENIRMGKPDITPEELDAAVRISRIVNDLPQLPHGMDTLVGEKGVMLSGGQKQRVAIARALVRDPAILILDDALSSVDTHTAADILAGLRDVLRTRTSIVIAQRMATVRDADLIIVLDGGRIVEQGTHADLLARGGLYARMVEREHLQEDEREDGERVQA